jgi:hypothetical protein
VFDSTFCDGRDYFHIGDPESIRKVELRSIIVTSGFLCFGLWRHVFE